jgi:hypothetical protein
MIFDSIRIFSIALILQVLMFTNIKHNSMGDKKELIMNKILIV